MLRPSDEDALPRHDDLFDKANHIDNMDDHMKIVSATHLGLVRDINEDRLLVKEYVDGIALLAVADGLGGHEAGEHAAQMAISALEALNADTRDIEGDLVQLVRNTNRDIMEASTRISALKGMGTTLTAAFVRKGTAHWVHVGDSRLYLCREGFLLQITEDQTPLGILVRGGEITKEEARLHPLHNLAHQLPRSGGIRDRVRISGADRRRPAPLHHGRPA